MVDSHGGILLHRIPVIFHIRFGLRRRADTKFNGAEAVLLVERTTIGIDLDRIQPEMLRGQRASMLKQCPAKPAMLAIGIDIQLVNKISRNRHESDRFPSCLGDPDVIVLQDYIAEISLIFLEGVTLPALEVREGLLPSSPP
jgi:hypothetical protein